MFFLLDCILYSIRDYVWIFTLALILGVKIFWIALEILTDGNFFCGYVVQVHVSCHQHSPLLIGLFVLCVTIGDIGNSILFIVYQDSLILLFWSPLFLCRQFCRDELKTLSKNIVHLLIIKSVLSIKIMTKLSYNFTFEKSSS